MNHPSGPLDDTVRRIAAPARRRTVADLMVRLLAPAIALLLAILLPTSAQATAFTPAGAIVVNSTADTGERCDQPTTTVCTLRGAIHTANARAGEDTITFNLIGGAKFTPATPLPAITQTVTIDGSGPTGAPQIEIDGSLIQEDVRPATLQGAVAEPLEQPKAKATRSGNDGVIRFLRPWGLDFKDADDSTIRGLIIHSFPYAQIGFDGADRMTVKGNWIGLKPDGSVSERKSVEDRMLGLALINSAVNLIGGPNADKNIISGTEIGLVLMDRGASGNLIYGNYIGTTTDGRGERANTETGILLTEPSNLAGRGTEQNRIVGNVVLGKREDSYGISVLAAKETDIWGNFVGLSASGLAESPTGEPLGHDIGIYVHDSPDTAIGGTGPAEFNLVAGNDLGIELNGGSDRSKIAGNLVGTEYGGKTATAASRNRYGVGVVADGLQEAPADITITENTVANTTEQGMYVTGAAKRVTVTSNRFGTDLDGVGKLPNKIGFATGRPAGGGDAPSDLTFGPGNVAAGNSTDGVQVLDGTNMVVRGNRIGVSADTKPLGNGTVGLNVQADGALVENNTVSANAQGIAVNGPTDDVIIRANRIGTAPNGEPTPSEDFGNAGAGVLILGTATGTRVGGSSSTDANLISGNGRGVHVAGDANNTAIRQNVIGLNTTADAPIPNDVGVYLAGGRNTVVGGALGIDARNYISRNYGPGIRINGAKKSVIMGNYITDNRGAGVLADAKGGDAVIGYTVEADGKPEDINCRETRCNRIEGNQGPGVHVLAKSQVTVRGNRMRGNTGLDVDLADAGATANDDNDADDWANTPVGVLPLTADGGKIVGQLDRFDADETLIDVYGFNSTEALKGRPRGGELIGTTFPNARGEWELATAKTYAAYGAVMTDRVGNTSEMSPICTGDQDGDALCDNWETGGIDYDADGTADLRLQDEGASPVKPDLFVEIDWQQGRKPHMKALYDVKQAFELAPKPIALHTVMGEEVPGTGAINAGGRSIGSNNDVQDYLGGVSGTDPCDGAFGSAEDRADQDCFRILGARKLAYRYAIFANQVSGGHAGAADPGRDAFLVTLGDALREDVMLGGGSGPEGCNRQYDACVAQLESAVFMHELGHTLGLLHGGDEKTENNEPTYLSVMNYWYLTRVPLNSRPLDFSRKTPLARNEAAFDEALPLYEAYPQRAENPWTEAAVSIYDKQSDRCLIERVRLDLPIDLDLDGQHETRRMGLNDKDLDSDPEGPEECQKPENQTWLTGVDDWSRLRYSRHGLTGWDEGTYESVVETADLPKATDLAAAIDTDDDGVSDAKDVCPAAADPGQEDADQDGLGDACLPFITERDVSLTLTAASANVPVGETRTVTLEVANSYPKPATGVVVAITAPAGVTVDTPRWEVGEIPARGTEQLELKVTGTAVGRGELKAEVVAAAEPDFDSTPDNHDAGEDDQAAKRLTTFLPGNVPTVSISPGSAREADDGTEAASVRINLDGQTGMTVEGRLRSVGGTATPGVDYEPVDTAISIAGSDRTRVDIKLFGDTLDEPDETIELELSGVDGAQPETVRGTFTISDDDDPRKPGELTYLGCMSRDYGPGKSCGQRESKLAAPAGTKAMTPDGRFLWIADGTSLVRLERDPATGGLSNAKCWVTAGPARDCASLGEVNFEPSAVHLTPDGKQLIVRGTNWEDGGNPRMSIVSLALDAAGEPTLTGCVGMGAPGCAVPIRSDNAILSPGGRFLITVPSGQKRSYGEINVYPLSSGKIEPSARCYAHPEEKRPCEPLTVVLDGSPWMDFSPDGKTLAIRSKHHLALLGWDEAAGTLSSSGGCLREGAGCRTDADCHLNGDKEFICPAEPAYLSGWGPVRFAPDGRALYVGAQVSDRVTALPRVADRTWSADGAMCVGRAGTGCALEVPLVDAATEIVTSPDGGDVYMTSQAGGVLSFSADRRTGALSGPRCELTSSGTASCPASVGGNALPAGSSGNMVFDPTGRDLYTTDELPGHTYTKYAVARFLRATRPPGGQNRAPLCSNADASVRPGETTELTLRCADPDGDPVTLRKTRGGGELTGTRLRYTAGTAAGVETVGFRAGDGGLESDEAEVRVTVGNPPACVDGAVSVMRRGTVELPLSCDRGTIEIVAQPAHGGVNGSTFIASPQGHDGVEYVKYAAYDPDTGVRSNVATITVTVLAPPPGPDIVEFGSVSLENDRGGANNGCSGSSCRPSGNGDLPFPMRCNGSPTQTPGSCSGSLEACTPSGCSKRAGGTRATAAAAKLKGSLGKVRFSIPVGQAKTVKLRLNAKARKELAKKGKLKLRIVTTVKLPTGKTVTSTRTLTVKKPLKKQRRR